MPAPSRGFTLIEVMIVVAVVAILAAIAYPSYQEHVRRSHRAAAQGFMLDVAARQQQYLLDMRRYAADLTELRMPVPAEIAPRYGMDLQAVANASPPAFTLTATPQGGQALDSCGTLTLDQSGARTPTTARCW